MILPYTPTQAKSAHNEWNAMCGHFSISAATGCALEDIRNAGVPLKGWINPTMINQTLQNLPDVQFKLIPLAGIDTTTNEGRDAILHIVSGYPAAILRVQWEGSWMNPGVPAGARYSRTHYIACKEGTIMDPAFNPTFSIRVQDWLQIVTEQIVPQIKGATGYHFTHAWIITPKETLAPPSLIP